MSEGLNDLMGFSSSLVYAEDWSLIEAVTAVINKMNFIAKCAC